MTRMMMTTMIRRSGTVLIVGILSLSLSAQDKDFGIWYGASVKKGITDKFNIKLKDSFKSF